MFNDLELSGKSLPDLKEILKHLGAKPDGTKKPELIQQIKDLQDAHPEKAEKIKQELSQNKEEVTGDESKIEKTKSEILHSGGIVKIYFGFMIASMKELKRKITLMIKDMVTK